ncbi:MULTISPECIES: formate/nitrite transporter family protein [Clostridium]|uniref:Formate/nitrite transporter family protein n=1 Tax=Clostridium cibarium TaxID=2762247 RepID=A0ABR8PU03_9CLOT|nr:MULTISPECIES: formate/nitrite transporter family protein [Clostridium]MBD7911655.1 formate/nitrite transporter family protein [Clostridium cibarium]
MFGDEIKKVSESAKAKIGLLRNNIVGYFISSMLAGIYVGIGIMLIFTIGGLLSSGGSPLTKILMGVSFGVALSLVIMAGAELFTGNNFVMAVGFLKKTVTLGDSIKVWIVSFIGNLFGSILTGYMFYLAGLSNGPVGEFIAKTTETKMHLGGSQLFFRGILCNLLVCLATWCSFKCKEESSKLIMIFWCLFAFITTGFEHSVANMTLMTIGLLSPFSASVSVYGYGYNLLFVTLGNMVGGIVFLAIPYYIISRNKNK